MKESAKTFAQKSKIVEEFIAYQRNERLASVYTLRNYSHAISEFARYFGEAYKKEIAWQNIELMQARDYVIELQRGLDRRTVHNRIAALRSFYRWGIKQGKWKTSPFKNISLPRLTRKLPVFLTEAQTERLLDSPKTREENGLPFARAHRDSLLLELLYGAGLRVSELCGITWENVDWENGLIRIFGKGRKERLCPPGEVAMKKLQDYKNANAIADNKNGFVFKNTHGGKLNPREVQLLLKDYLKIAGLPSDITPHKLRHTFATHLVGRGANLRAVQELMGHKSPVTTQIYAHLTLGKLQDAYKKAHPRA